MLNQQSLNWTKNKLNEFEEIYKKALKDNNVDFMFEDHKFLTAYAKYLIEYLEDRFKKDT